MKQYVAETCEVTCENNGKKTQADILKFQPGVALDISINRSVKVPMKWNGRIYEGHVGGMSFVSKGPEITNVQQGRIKR
jgi:hypothetical protein